MKKIINMIWLIGVMFITFQLSAQVLPPENVRGQLKAINSTTNTISLSSILQNPNQSVQPIQNELIAVVTLPTIDNIAKIHLKIGTTVGGSDLVLQAFDLDNPTTLPTGFSYYRDELTLYLGVGSFTNLTLYHIEATIEDTNGGISSTVSYSYDTN